MDFNNKDLYKKMCMCCKLIGGQLSNTNQLKTLRKEQQKDGDIHEKNLAEKITTQIDEIDNINHNIR